MSFGNTETLHTGNQNLIVSGTSGSYAASASISAFATSASAATSITFLPASASYAGTDWNAINNKPGVVSQSAALTKVAALTVSGTLLVSGNQSNIGFFISASAFSGSGTNIVGIVSSSYAGTDWNAINNKPGVVSQSAALTRVAALTVSGALLVSGNTSHQGFFVSASGFSGSGANITGVISSSYAGTTWGAINNIPIGIVSSSAQIVADLAGQQVTVTGLTGSINSTSASINILGVNINPPYTGRGVVLQASGAQAISGWSRYKSIPAMNSERDDDSVLLNPNGRITNNDGDFAQTALMARQTGGTHGVSVYNNAGGNGVQFQVLNDAGAPNETNKVLRIFSSGTFFGDVSPGWGGLTLTTGISTNSGSITGFSQYRPGDRLIQVIKAKIPGGYNISWATNSTGNSSADQWFTPTSGTNNWETYIHETRIGLSGTLLTTSFFYLSGTPSGSNTQFSWDVASIWEYAVDNENTVVAAPYLNVGNNQNTSIAYGQILAASNIITSGNVLISGSISQYNGISTAGWGVPAVYAHDSPGSGQNITVTSYTVGPVAGSFIVSATTIPFGTGGLGGTSNYTVSVLFSDAISGGDVTASLSFTDLTGSIVTKIISPVSTGYYGIPLYIKCSANTTIKIVQNGIFAGAGSGLTDAQITQIA